MRVSTFLADLGYNASQIGFLRAHHLPALMEQCAKLILNGLNKLSNANRVKQIVTCRFGFDGECLETLQQIADKYDLSRERVRQLEKVSFRFFRGSTRGPQFEAEIRLIVDELLIQYVASATEEDFIFDLPLPDEEPPEVPPEPMHYFATQKTKDGDVMLIVKEIRMGEHMGELIIMGEELEAFYQALRTASQEAGLDLLKEYSLVHDIRQKYPRAYQIWTKEEEAQLRMWYIRGETANEIAEKLERQPGAVRMRISKLKL